MELRHYFNILRRSWQLVVGLPVLVALVTLALWLFLPPTYEITAQMLVTQQQIPGTVAPLTLPNYENYHSWVASEYIDDDLPQLVTTRRFTTDIAAWAKAQHGVDLDPMRIAEGIEAERKHRMIYLTATAARADDARIIAQGAVEMLRQNGLTYWGREESAALQVSEVDLPQQAERSTGIVSLAINILLRGLLALILAIGLAFLRHYLDRTIHNRRDLEMAGVPAAGVIPRDDRSRSQSAAQNGSSAGLVMLERPQTPAAEGYRTLRTHIQYNSPDKPLRTIVATAPSAQEGTVPAVANLAVTLAQAGQRVVLVDADLRRPTLHTLFKVSNAEGLSTVLEQEGGQLPLQSTGVAGLSVLPAGPPAMRPADLMASRRMEAVVAQLLEQADVILFNTPPINAVTDAAVLAARVDGALVVTQAGKTTQERAREARRLLDQVKAHTIGAVLTDAPIDNAQYSY